MDMLLVAGLWLKRNVWEGTVEALRGLGHEARAVALPGVDDGASATGGDPRAATLEDQVEAVLAEVDAADRPLLVGHSAAAALAWMVTDRRPSAIASVALIGGFPLGDGKVYADFFPLVDGVMPFPGWGPFAGPDAADLDARDRQRMASDAVPVPGGVAHATVSLRDPRRFNVPVVMICPEFTPDQARAWVAGGEVPELALARHVSYVDIATGHWPMVTQPAALARLLDAAARKS